jgi:dienelactone hydrolase
MAFGLHAAAQEYGKPDREAPGDAAIQEYLAREACKLESSWLAGVKSAEDWEKLRGQYRQEYFYMLGLRPMPEKTPLAATITHSIQRDGYVVDAIHYQSRPRLYVTGNLYRPAKIKPGERLPAVFYVCGHAGMGRDGNKTAYQSHGIWLAKHGYICLTVDSLQLGEIGATHHGTYRENRWWWHSRGYTPAGVECLNGIRGIDYLASRPDVDPERIAVTGISGGGAATFWIAAADERVKVAVPVSGMADLESYVGNRVINGHCDCMFLYNTFQWPWTRIAALIAPRPMLFTNSDADAIFPMDANDRVIARLERVYSLYGASDRVDAMVSIGGHAYRKDIRQAAFRFLNTYLKNDPRPIADSELDLVETDKSGKQYPIEPKRLRVFVQDSDLPKDELNTQIDRHFVPMAEVPAPKKGEFEAWKKGLWTELRRVSLRGLPERVELPRLTAAHTLEGEPGVTIAFQSDNRPRPGGMRPRLLLVVRGPGQGTACPEWVDKVRTAADIVDVCLPRGVGATRWTQKNPPNYVERSQVLLGRTVDAGRIWDIAAAARYLRKTGGGELPVYVVGEGSGAVLAAYAALLEPEIAGVILREPTMSHMDKDAPQLLNVLRVCDVPDVLGMLAPRPLRISGVPAERLAKVRAAYDAAGASDRFVVEEK